MEPLDIRGTDFEGVVDEVAHHPVHYSFAQIPLILGLAVAHPVHYQADHLFLVTRQADLADYFRDLPSKLGNSRKTTKRSYRTYVARGEPTCEPIIMYDVSLGRQQQARENQATPPITVSEVKHLRLVSRT